MGEKQPSAAATRLAEVAIAEHMRCPGLDSPGWEKYGSPGDCALHRVALALDDAGVGKAVKTIQEVRGTLFRLGKYTARDLGEYTTWVDDLVKDLATALAALTGESNG